MTLQYGNFSLKELIVTFNVYISLSICIYHCHFDRTRPSQIKAAQEVTLSLSGLVRTPLFKMINRPNKILSGCLKTKGFLKYTVWMLKGCFKEQGFLKYALMMFQGWFNYTLRTREEEFMRTSKIFQLCFEDSSRIHTSLLEGCCKDEPRLFQGSFPDDSNTLTFSENE